MSCKHYFDSGEVATGDPAVEFRGQMPDRLGDAFGAGRHRMGPGCGPTPFSRQRSASASEDEQRAIRINQLCCCIEDALVETADKAVLSRAQDKCPATTGCCPAQSFRFGQ